MVHSTLDNLSTLFCTYFSTFTEVILCIVVTEYFYTVFPSYCVLPDGSPGSPGWSGTYRRSFHQSTPPTQNHLKPAQIRKIQNDAQYKHIIIYLVTYNQFSCCTCRRSSPSEKRTPSIDTDCPFLSLADTRAADLVCFWSAAATYRRKQHRQKTTKRFSKS